MECFYQPDLNIHSMTIKLPKEEERHLKALRIKENEYFLVTNGKGLTARCSARFGKNVDTVLTVDSFRENYNETNFRISVGIGILDNRERLELAAEKAQELGATDFYLIKTEFSSVRKINIERLKLKAIAAMKQSCRSVLMNIEVISVNDIKSHARTFDSVVICDSEGSTPDLPQNALSVLVLIGPEGGFSKNELMNLKKIKSITLWRLGTQRLRAETAMIASLGIISASVQ